jgi:hypothetical protein
MDLQVATRVQRLKKAVADKDTQQLWILTTAAIEASFVDYFSLKGKEADRMRGRSKIRTTTTDGGSIAQRGSDGAEQVSDIASVFSALRPRRAPVTPRENKGTSRESDASKRIREVKRRADNIRTQANRLVNIARDIHAMEAASKDDARSPAVPEDDPRAQGIQHTAIAFRKQAIVLGYSHAAGVPLKDDAADGGVKKSSKTSCSWTSRISCPARSYSGSLTTLAKLLAAGTNTTAN